MSQKHHEAAAEMGADGSTSVLVVDDEPSVADLYAEMLRDEYDVTTVYGGEPALVALDATVDVVLLDRRMPDLSGDEVLAAIRQRNLGCRVAMVTAVEPELDDATLEFDDYLVKPVSEADLSRTVGRLELLGEYEDKRHELSSLEVRRNVLELELREAELADSEEFRAIEERIAELEAELPSLKSELGSDFPAARKLV